MDQHTSAQHTPTPDRTEEHATAMAAPLRRLMRSSRRGEVAEHAEPADPGGFYDLCTVHQGQALCTSPDRVIAQAATRFDKGLNLRHEAFTMALAQMQSWLKEDAYKGEAKDLVDSALDSLVANTFKQGLLATRQSGGGGALAAFAYDVLKTVEADIETHVHRSEAGKVDDVLVALSAGALQRYARAMKQDAIQAFTREYLDAKAASRADCEGGVEAEEAERADEICDLQVSDAETRAVVGKHGDYLTRLTAAAEAFLRSAPSDVWGPISALVTSFAERATAARMEGHGDPQAGQIYLGRVVFQVSSQGQWTMVESPTSGEFRGPAAGQLAQAIGALVGRAGKTINTLGVSKSLDILVRLESGETLRFDERQQGNLRWVEFGRWTHLGTYPQDRREVLERAAAEVQAQLGPVIDALRVKGGK